MKSQIAVSIIGPTAVGKTELALQLTKVPFLQKKFTGFDIISADSRQVYRGLEIISGADIPEELDHHVKLYGLSMIEPNQEWSLAHFRKFGQQIIHQSWSTHRLPIIVGGTGLYHHHLFSKDPLIDIQPDQEVRQKAALMTTEELQAWLKEINPTHFSQMNHSDQHNPRRLVRAIEIGLNGEKSEPPSDTNSENIIIGLTDSLANIQTRIEERVKYRFHHGAIQEVEHLLALDPPPTKPALSTTGVAEIVQYLQDQVSEAEIISHWARRELQYAKRQLTWWKKYGHAQWFDRANAACFDQIVTYLASQLAD